jgi:hypothetical protein
MTLRSIKSVGMRDGLAALDFLLLGWNGFQKNALKRQIAVCACMDGG